ncbi:MAG: DUF4290 domain-containing protein [Paludibacteraceae bacterium]
MSNTIHYAPKSELIMPEYGRNIQQMIQYAMSIDDRAERTRCARTIIDVMGNMFPYLRDVEGFKHKLWDHLYIMSGFKLDIDYPFDVKKPQDMPHPEPIPYNTQNIKYRHYGRWLQTLIKKASEYEEGEQRTALIRLIANNMKKDYVTWNKDLADDNKIFDDLRELSHGAIDIKSNSMTLTCMRNGNNAYKNNKNNGKNGKKSAK